MYSNYTMDQLIQEAHFSLYGPIVGKERAIPGKEKMYTPVATRNYEAAIRKAYHEKYGDKMLVGSIVLIVKAYVPRPENVKNDDMWELMKAGVLRPTSRGADCSNILKAVEDALNSNDYKRGAYPDDNLICDSRCMRYFDDEERLEVELRSINQNIWLKWHNTATDVVFRSKRSAQPYTTESGAPENGE